MIPRSGSFRLSPEMWENVLTPITAGLIDDAVTYTPDVEADEMIADIAAAEVTAAGYTRVSVDGRTVSWDSANERWRYQCSSPNFGPIETGVDVAGWFVALAVSDDTDSPLLAILTFTTPEATDDGDFIVTVDSEGVIRSKDITA